MIKAFSGTWALFIGVFLLMIGNGSQGTLLGIRGGLEGFSTFELSMVMSAYFAGFLGGSQLAPGLIRRVGHVRVFAALASFISAVLILYPSMANPWVWIPLRALFGFCMCGVYVTAESWLNSASSNELRGQTLSLYLIVQMAGITTAQLLPMLADPGGFILFVIPSVLVSISFAPILLSVSPTPPFETSKRMRIVDLFAVSPLACVGVLILGGVYSALFGMASVFATQIGLSVTQVSVFVAAIFLGGLLFQFPIGWLSDRVDRRGLILIVSLGAALVSILPMVGVNYGTLLIVAFVLGGLSNPLYGLVLAHANDFLETDDMASAAGQLLFLNGAAAVVGPLVIGLAMSAFGPEGFFGFLAAILSLLAGYAAWRTTRRAGPAVEDTGEFAPVLPSASVVSMETVQDVAAAESPDNPLAPMVFSGEDEEEDVAV